jgi:hypothetical protein
VGSRRFCCFRRLVIAEGEQRQAMNPRAQGEEVMSDHPAKKRKARRKGLPPPQVELEFRNTDQAIARTADRIKGEIEKLFSRLPLKYVAWDYVVERLIDELITDNPELLDWLDGIKSPRGDISVRLAEALADWRDSQVHERTRRGRRSE